MPDLRRVAWDEEQFAEVRPGVFGATVHTPQLTATLYRYRRGSSWEEHDHPQDQITMVLEGDIDFHIGGESIRLRQGSCWPFRAAHITRRPCPPPAPRQASTCSPAAKRLPMHDWLGLLRSRAVVAGGAGTLGSAVVRGLLDAGAAVGVIDTSGEGLARLDDRVAAKERADLSDPGSAHKAVALTRERLGGLDAFIHCAGINIRKSIEEYTPNEWQQILAVNLTSAFHTATEAAVGMRRQRHGRIVFFSSVAGT